MDRRLISVVTTDIDLKVEEGYNEWYERHIRDVVAIPGWVKAQRYRCLDGEPRYLSLYQISGPEYAAIGSVSSWTTEMQAMQQRGYEEFWPHIESYRARNYELISEVSAEDLRRS
jgi:hypothetical protein